MSVSLRQFAPGSNDVPSQEGGDEIVAGLVNGVVYRSLLLNIDNENATPLTSCGEESTAATDIREDDLDDESVAGAQITQTARS